MGGPPARDRRRPTRRLPALAVVVLTLVVLTLVGCSETVEPFRMRLIEPEPSVAYDLSIYTESTAVHEWTFHNDDPFRLDVKRRGRPRPQLVDQTLRVESSARQSSLLWETEFPAADVDVIEIEARGKPRGRVLLTWGTGPKQRFRAAKQLKTHWTAQTVKSGRLRLEVAGHPRWTGQISRLKLSFSPQAKSFSIKAIRGLALTTAADLATSLSKKTWKVDLGDDVRSGFVMVPEESRQVEVLIPEGARLHASYGIPKARRAEATFVVSGVVEGSSPQELFTSTIDTSSDGDVWHTASIDLAAHAGKTIRFDFNVFLNRTLDLPTEGLPAWANPEIVASEASGGPPNVILISIDTLRADHMSIYGHDRPTTPGIDSWARRNAAVFENTVAAAPYTVPAHVSMFTGLNALHHRIDFAMPIPEHMGLLPELLHKKGYATYAVTGGGYLRPHLFGRGFDRFQFWNAANGKGELTHGLTSAAGWLEEVTGPFFLFLHTYEVHSPYIAREPHFSRLTGRDGRRFDAKRLHMTDYRLDAETKYQTQRQFTANKAHVKLPKPPALPPDLEDLAGYLYDSRLAFVDEQLTAFLDDMDQLGHLENTVVVITSDHGELLGEHGLAGHLYLLEPNLKIPLLISAPGIKSAGRRISQQVRTTDVTPTILDLIGAQALSGIDGESLAPLLRGRQVRSRRAAWAYAPLTNWGISLRVDNRTKFIFSNNPFAPGPEAHAIYDLESDPHESTPLDPRDFQDLHDLIATEFEANARGVRLRFASSETEGLTGIFEGQGLKRWNLKSTDIPCTCLSWTDVGQAHFEVPPDTAYTVFLDGWHMSKMKISIAPQSGDDSHRFEHVIKRSEARDGLVIEWRDDAWQVSPARDEPDLHGVEIRLWGEEAAEAPEADLEAGDMTEQLKALGYIN